MIHNFFLGTGPQPLSIDVLRMLLTLAIVALLLLLLGSGLSALPYFVLGGAIGVGIRHGTRAVKQSRRT
jgi:hypothetical protein